MIEDRTPQQSLHAPTIQRKSLSKGVMSTSPPQTGYLSPSSNLQSYPYPSIDPNLPGQSLWSRTTSFPLKSLYPQTSHRNEPLASRESQVVGAVPLDSLPKFQCWQHGCNGRKFSTLKNLLRHKKEKASGAKIKCLICGQQFTRRSARTSHIKKNICKKRLARDTPSYTHGKEEIVAEAQPVDGELETFTFRTAV
ncbi:hypothetical protein CC78DRAFT_586298 [Lojkania enalia]|uniref:C2H2-type domain-containing protein n=1 Tax=Lojkania enalia TaxID=147567 RepID=A0A9P4MVL5_9PLEO|nr:hypothetical protein CC78DRAFT_586298 [Didymosphaeria enalia]